MKRIIITRRSDDYHACLADKPGVWGCGKTAREAFSDLVATWPEVFDIEIQYPPALSRRASRGTFTPES